MWTVDHRDDDRDEPYPERWEVGNAYMSFTAWDKEEAEWLCEVLNEQDKRMAANIQAGLKILSDIDDKIAFAKRKEME